MKKSSILILLIPFTIFKAQALSTTFKNTTLDVVTDASSIALGESFVANPSGNFSFFENPAALPLRGETKFFYQTRSNGWMKLVENFNFTSAGFITNSPFGSIGVGYCRSTTGRVPITAGDDTKTTEDHNQMILLSLSKNIFNSLSFGVGVKMFNRGLESYGGPSYQISSTNTVLFDFGLLFHLNKLLSTENNSDHFSIGLSLQNFGTDYEEEYKNLFNEKVKQTLPKFLRVGLSYEINLLLGRQNAINIDFVVSGEYKNLLNPGLSEKGSVDYWGGGIEAKLFKMISLRVGGFITPENTVLFDRAKLNSRYGAGLELPVSLIGLETPIKVKIDYAIIPINQISIIDVNGNPGKSKRTLYAFGLSIIYNR